MINPDSRGKFEYENFVPMVPTDPELLKPYTDALSDDRIDALFDTMPETLENHTVSFRADTRYGVNERLVDLSGGVEVSTFTDFIAEGEFTKDTVDLTIKTFNNDTPETLHIRKGASDNKYLAFTDDSFDISPLDDDQMVEFCLRAADSDPLTRHKVELNESDTQLKRVTFPLTLAAFWQGLAVRSGGRTSSSRYLQVPVPTTDGSLSFARLFQDEIEKPREIKQRLIIEHATVFDELDAEQVIRLELQYISSGIKTQTSALRRFTASGVGFEKAYLRITRKSPDKAREDLDPSDPAQLLQFQALLNFMIEAGQAA
jgi:hypothetical protein